MSKRVNLVVVGLLFLALTTRPASAWWETVVTTNMCECDCVEYLESCGTQYIDTGIASQNNLVYDFYLIETTIQNQKGFFGFNESSSTWLCTGANMANWGSSWFYVNFANTETRISSMGSISRNGRYIFDYTDGNAEVYNNGSKVWSSSLVGSYNGLCRVFIFAECWLDGLPRRKGSGRIHYFNVSKNGSELFKGIPVVHDGDGKMLDLVHNTLHANAGYGAFTYGSVTGTVAFATITTNRVYHTNPPASAYDVLSPWNAPERTRIGGDDRTFRPSATIKEN